MKYILQLRFFKTTPFSLLNSYRRSAQYGDFYFSVVINIRQSSFLITVIAGALCSSEKSVPLATLHNTTSVSLATLHNITSQKTYGYCNNLIWPVRARMIAKLDQKRQEVSKYRNLMSRCACGVKTPECSLLQKAVRMHSYMLS